MSERDKNKIYFTFIFFLLLFFIIISRAFFIQIISKEKLLTYSKTQLIRETTIFPNRGNIYDRNGHPLSINIQTYNIFSIPKMMTNREKTLRALTRIVPNLTVRHLKKVLKNRKKFTWIERQIKLNESQIKKIKDLKGIFLEKTTKRLYPNHELMAHILGFVGVDNVGLSGIEYQFNTLLKGDAKIIKYLKDAKGRPIKFESYDTETKAQNLYLTLDKDIQAIAEKYLKSAIQKHRAKRGGIGIMNADNGEILAMANYPTFDPNQFALSKEADRRPSFVTDPFEPGSVFKIFTVISAIENKIVTSKTNYFCEYGQFRVEGHVIRESDTSKKYEWLSISDIIKYSSNIGSVKVAFDLGFPLFDKTIKKFGFDQKTAIELPGESRGIYNHKGNISKLSLSNLSFGQGVAVTAIQMLSAYSALANGGVYYPPTLIKAPKTLEETETRKGKRILHSNIVRTAQDMLFSVVEEGTGTPAQIPYFKIAGKTGTAQKIDADGRYTGYISNFIGFPLDIEKKFVVYAYIENPKGPYYTGSQVAAPIVKKMMEYILFKNKEYENLSVQAKKAGPSNIDLVKINKSMKNRFSKGKIPNFIGLDKKSSMNLAKKIGIRLKHRGIGVVVKQNIKSGTPLLRDSVIVLDHRPPNYE
ncbi:MAG: penicillin-binding transpeptidase domain-containing protein [Bacteriovoracales bacterium]|nr:penicillin-binding transpeptidase domain-containing protein [Bacteriovoracales bacterium]